MKQCHMFQCHHISYICIRIARNNGIISKLRYYLTFPQMKQIYYSLIYPYISYATLACYLGVLLDETMSFNHHISYICIRIARNNGIISKLRYYLTFPQMKQIYCSLIYPYISYATLAWGSAFKTHIDKIQIKQNHSARLIFFATDHGEHTESALPLLNLLDILTVHNVYRFQILKFTYLWHKGLLPKPFSNYFQYFSNVHEYNTRYASKQNLYLKKVRTNMRKQTIRYAACIIWDKIPLKLNELSVYQFSKQLKP